MEESIPDIPPPAYDDLYPQVKTLSGKSFIKKFFIAVIIVVIIIIVLIFIVAVIAATIAGAGTLIAFIIKTDWFSKSATLDEYAKKHLYNKCSIEYNNLATCKDGIWEGRAENRLWRDVYPPKDGQQANVCCKL